MISLFEPSFGDESSVTSNIVGDLGTDKDDRRPLPALPLELLFIMILGGILDDPLEVIDDTEGCSGPRPARDTQTARVTVLATMMCEDYGQDKIISPLAGKVAIKTFTVH